MRPNYKGCYYIRYFVISKYSIQVHFGFAGSYYCQVTYKNERTDDQTIKSQRATLFVRGIVSDPKHSVGIEGKESEISCTVGGDKPTKVKFHLLV